ncbi:MAG TPA: hypothetical protein DGG94_03325 [Micromonosporaceae bacterium]|nr:hypothetical protein [Micromonosporaceae bacterium]
MRRMTLAAPLAIVCVLAAGASCDSKSDNAGPAPEFSTVLTPSATAVATATTGPVKGSPAGPVWPSPEDCTTHNPATVTKHYEAGIHTINDGTRTLMRFHGGPSESIGQQALTLAKRFRKHCFLGRGNTREEKYSYIFDYWLEPSGMTPSIPDPDCSTYDRNNLTVEDMGSGHGWRVKEHDHVLHLFNNESDARNGKLVLAKYGRICFIGQGYDGDDQDVVSYFL